MKLLLVFTCLVIAISARRTFFGDQVYRITIENQKHLEVFELLQEKYELDVWRNVREFGGTADVRVKKVDLFAVKIALGMSKMNYEVFIEDVEELIRGERSISSADAQSRADSYYEVYHTFEEIQLWISDMAVQYPDLATESLVGTSFEGRAFSALTVGKNSNNPNFVLNCGIHAREWVTPATCMWSAKTLAEGYDKDPVIRDILDKVNFVFIPSSNPDGYEYTWSADRMWRKTRSNNRNSICVGVDPNRNFDANHCGIGSSTNHCSDTYCGPAPFSEPCTAAQREFVEGLNDVKMYVDVHAYSQLWMFPYGYTTSRTADHFKMNQIATDSVAAIKAVHGETYVAGQISTTIYEASGSTADYFYDKAGIKCTFATELRDTGRYGFILPERLILPTAQESFAAFIVMAEAIVNGQC